MITKSEGSDVNRPLPGITAAGIIEPWPRIEADTVLNNNSCGQPDIHDNIISGFISDVLDMSGLVSLFPIGSPQTAEMILSDYKASTEAVFGGNSMDWYWYDGSFSSTATGMYTAAARRTGQIGFDYLYQCVNTTDEYYVRFDGWDKDFTNVTGPLTLNAVYTNLGTIPVESVTLSSHTATITVGDNLSLNAAVLPNDATHTEVTWSSDKTLVAAVDQTGR